MTARRTWIDSLSDGFFEISFDRTLRHLIMVYRKRERMSARRFGHIALGDRGFTSHRLKRDSSVGLNTADTADGLVFHDPDGEDVGVRVLTALAFPDVWPGWRGNALIGDFHRDFLQPGCPVLTCLTVMAGDAADGEKAFLKSARATQQAGMGIARYLPGLPEKARDWRFVKVDIEALAHGLARADYSGGRRVLAMHAWLAEVRDSELRDKEREGEGKKRLALRTMDIEALADVLARTSRWDDGVAPAAAAFDESLRSLGSLDAEHRRGLSLYSLLAETVLAGLGTAVAEAALEAAKRWLARYRALTATQRERT